jgi:hypothetical protein
VEGGRGWELHDELELAGGNGSCFGCAHKKGLSCPFIGRARGGEMSWVASAALRAKGRAGQAERCIYSWVATHRSWGLGRREQGCDTQVNSMVTP